MLIYEQGGPAVFSGLVMRGLPGLHGRFGAEQVRSRVRDWRSGHMPITRLVAIENTHNSSGGRVWRLEEIDAVVETCRELELRVHLDGARIVNAATALGVPAAEIGRRFDTVTLCLSKGLGCPLGALVAGSAELMVAARRAKHLFGGAMRQAGIVAAAGVYALEHNVARIADDHARARRLAEGWAERGTRSRPRAGRDELRPARPGAARSDRARGDRPAREGRRRALGDRAPGHPAGGDASRTLRRRHRARGRGGAAGAGSGARCPRLSRSPRSSHSSCGASSATSVCRASPRRSSATASSSGRRRSAPRTSPRAVTQHPTRSTASARSRRRSPLRRSCSCATRGSSTSRTRSSGTSTGRRTGRRCGGCSRTPRASSARRRTRPG